MNCCQSLHWSKRVLKLNLPTYVIINKRADKSLSFGEMSFFRKYLFTRNQTKSKLSNYSQQCQIFKISAINSSAFNYSIFHNTDQKISSVENINQNGLLSKAQMEDLILRLTENERKALLVALQEYNSNQIKAEYEGQLATTRWRSKFGRPSKLPTLGDVDPTGSYCHLPEDWLKKKYGKFNYRKSPRHEYTAEILETEKVPAPTGQQLFRIGLFNAVPFVGFGFLDNFIMIVAGDYIDETLGSLVTISTMAAAALGNTISDVMGIGSAWYVELAASKVGLKPPNLSPIQLDMVSSRRAANLGRALGIIVGCLLGMLPLLFISKEDNKKKENSHKDSKN